MVKLFLKEFIVIGRIRIENDVLQARSFLRVRWRFCNHTMYTTFVYLLRINDFYKNTWCILYLLGTEPVFLYSFNSSLKTPSKVSCLSFNNFSCSRSYFKTFSSCSSANSSVKWMKKNFLKVLNCPREKL